MILGERFYFIINLHIIKCPYLNLNHFGPKFFRKRSLIRNTWLLVKQGDRPHFQSPTFKAFLEYTSFTKIPKQKYEISMKTNFKMELSISNMYHIQIKEFAMGQQEYFFSENLHIYTSNPSTMAKDLSLNFFTLMLSLRSQLELARYQ